MSTVYHAHFLPCPCGAGAPDYGWFSSGRVPETHYAQCPCGSGVTGESEDVCAAMWNASVRAKGARVAA